MSDKRAIVLVVVVVFAGIFGASQAGMFALMDANPTTAATTMRYLGHVTTVVSDSNGNIKAYFQTDNEVVNSGRNCATNLVFGTTIGGSPACTFVDRMAIGTSSASLDIKKTALVDETDNGKTTALTATVITVALGGVHPVFEYTNTFDIQSGDNGESVGETGLFDSADHMFARTLIGPVPVQTDDKITVTWTLIID